MNIFTTIRNVIRRTPPKDSFTLPVINPPPLSEVTKVLLTTAEMAHYLGLDAKAANAWQMGQGPIQPTTEKVDGTVWLRWRTDDVRRLAAGR